jgi:glutathione S-transferase
MSRATLTINSRTYGAWSLRGWLLCMRSGLEFDVHVVASDDPAVRAELLLLSPSVLVPSLEHDGLRIWDTLAIGEYLAEILPEAGLLPADLAQRTRCRSVSGEIHAGFSHLRTALPMNVRARHPGFRVFGEAQADIDRIAAVWRECLDASGGPFLFGTAFTMADAMYAPVCSRFVTYDVALPAQCAAYVETVTGLPEMRQWAEDAADEPDAFEELEVEF